ncbi:MAG: hypothetical protein IJA72_00325 [Clostridia bacterium]|nr:hypothetical protein [Clostridia bacterium]
MTLEELIVERRKRAKNKRRKLTKDERKRQVRDWCTFYRRNWDIYATDRLGINLKPFQAIVIYLIGVSDVFYLMCSRGLSKTFMAALAAFIECLLYPNSHIVLTATTMKTAKKMVTDKMEDELCGRFSPVLKWMKENKLIEFHYRDEEIVVDFKMNDSWIRVLPAVEGSRGERVTFLIFEECRLLKKNIVDSVFIPMRSARVPAYRTKPEYAEDDRLVERTKIIYLTSTRYKHEWFWNQWKTCVNNVFADTKLVYNVFAGDILTSVYHKFKTKEDVEADKAQMSDLEVRMELLNEPQGEIEGSFYTLNMFNANRKIKRPFVPPTPEEYVLDYARGDIPWFREKKDEELRLLYIDFAFSDTVNSDNTADNTVIGCMSGYPNESKTRYLRNCEYMETFSGGKKDETLKRIRELFFYYDADVIFVDLRNGGEDRWQDLYKQYYHEELGIQMSGFGIYPDDDIISFFCDKTKADNLRGRTVDQNASNVVIPVIGTDERNNNYHLSMKTALQNHFIRFLEDEMTIKERLDADGSYSALNSHEKMRRILGNVQLDIMIIDEAIKLQQVIKKGFVSLVTVGRNKRDRIVACEYCNFFFHLKELEMIKKQQNTEYDDMSQWKVWADTNGRY